MTVITVGDFRARLDEHLARSAEDREELVITRDDEEPMALLPLADLRSLRETLHLLAHPENTDRLRRSLRQLDADEGLERAWAHR